jgi:hypothetical protein
MDAGRQRAPVQTLRSGDYGVRLLSEAISGRLTCSADAMPGFSSSTIRPAPKLKSGAALTESGAITAIERSSRSCV